MVLSNLPLSLHDCPKETEPLLCTELCYFYLLLQVTHIKNWEFVWIYRYMYLYNLEIRIYMYVCIYVYKIQFGILFGGKHLFL